ncbi:MAG: hypothetical protein QOG63_229 [Thermoleophilaceae bacterium]|jgi:hypothetical protein|nr:hypothetical protein [Thermoleophilaceae bacterium]
MPTEPEPLTLSEVAKRAVQICDPEDRDGVLGDFLAQFEDADEPITTIGSVEERVALASEGVDFDVEDPAVQMAGAVIVYLAYRRDQIDDDDADVLRLAARAEYKGEPPEPIRDWLSDRGVSV